MGISVVKRQLFCIMAGKKNTFGEANFSFSQALLNDHYLLN